MDRYKEVPIGRIFFLNRPTVRKSLIDTRLKDHGHVKETNLYVSCLTGVKRREYWNKRVVGRGPQLYSVREGLPTQPECFFLPRARFDLVSSQGRNLIADRLKRVTKETRDKEVKGTDSKFVGLGRSSVGGRD